MILSSFSIRNISQTHDYIKSTKHDNMCLITIQRYVHCLCITNHITICRDMINKYQVFSPRQTADFGEEEAKNCRFRQDARAALEIPCGNRSCTLSTKRIDWTIGDRNMNAILIARRDTLRRNNDSVSSMITLGDEIELRRGGH
ncbi:hypothetical protein QC760_006870 [Botrytis cinerea]